MATISKLEVSVVRNVANADVTVTYEIFWSAFDKVTNLDYVESVSLIGDGTQQDGDDGPAGDDPIGNGSRKPFVTVVAANGAGSTSRTINRTIPSHALDEDHTSGNDSDEIRAVVKLTPQLPEAVTEESSNFAVVTA